MTDGRTARIVLTAVFDDGGKVESLPLGSISSAPGSEKWLYELTELLRDAADEFDPLVDDVEDFDMGCGDSYCHICGDPGDLFDDLEEEDDDEV